MKILNYIFGFLISLTMVVLGFIIDQLLGTLALGILIFNFDSNSWGIYFKIPKPSNWIWNAIKFHTLSAAGDSIHFGKWASLSLVNDIPAEPPGLRIQAGFRG